MFSLSLFFLVYFQIQAVFAQEKLVWKYYDSTMNCANELASGWSLVSGGSFINNSCQKACSFGSNTYYSFFLMSSSYPSGFEITKTLTNQASVVGLDIVFYVNSQFSISLYSDNTLIEAQTLQQITYDTFPQEIIYDGMKCSGTTFKSIFKSFYKKVSNPSKFTVQFTNMPLNYGIIKIYMWANCVLNCSTCLDGSNCSTCIQGFRLIKMPSGQQVCSQYTECTKSNCQECAISGTTEVCISCLPGYTLSSPNICIQFGSTCSAGQYRHTDSSCQNYQSSCQMQQLGTSSWQQCYQSPDSTAIKCPINKQILIYERSNYNTRLCSCNFIANCDQCTSSKCTQCFPGYTLSGSTTCSFSVCPPGTIQNTLTKRCDPSSCPGVYCSKCDDFLCYQCISSSYYVEGSNPIHCKLCQVTNCQKCNPDGKCGQCKPGYFIDGSGNCSNCADNCLQCNDPIVCNACVTNYILSSDKKSCSCSIADCQLCNPNDGAVCQICNHGSFNSLTKQCSCAVTNCSLCNQNTNSSCLQCNGVYIKDNNNQCQCSILNCNTCNSNGDKCTTCISGYQISTDKTQCSCSVQNCSVCNPSFGFACQNCVQGYAIKNSGAACTISAVNCTIADLNDGSKCLQCKQGYLNQNNICLCNVANCMTCNLQNGSICDQCQLNYISSNNYTQCNCQVTSCQTCNQNNGLICDKCVDGYNLSNNNSICSCSAQNCSTCFPNNGLQCQTCNNGYTLNNGTCQCSVNNCLACNLLDGSKCDTCISGYFLDQNKSSCKCLVSNCTTCQANDGTKCQNCQSGYSLNADSSQCLCNIKNCNICDTQNIGQCLTCTNGYDLSQNKQTCSCHVLSCQKCDPLDGNKCITCINNFKLINPSICSCNVENCNQCSSNDGNKCNQCNGGFTLSSDWLSCACSILNCDICDKVNIGQCNQCVQGFILQNKSKCECAVENCDQCNISNGAQCITCNSGFNKNSNGGCDQVCGILACDQCDPQDYTSCLKCQTGYLFSKEKGLCILQEVNTFSVQQNSLDNGYKINVSFIEKVQVARNLTDILEATIINYEQVKDYVIIEITQIDTSNIIIEVSLLKNCKGQKMKVTIKDQSFIQTNNLQKSTEEIALKDYVKLTDSQIQQAQQTKEVTQGIKTTLLSTMLPIAMLGNFYVLFNTIDLTTFIYYLLYVKVRYPMNVINFCSIFKNFQFAFIPNLWQEYVLDGYAQNDTPETFILNGSDAYFLNGAGQSQTIICGIMTIYFILKILAYQEFYKPLKVYVQSKIQSGWEYCGFFDLIWTVYMYVTVSAFLQFYSFDFSNDYAFINYSTWSLLLLAVFLIPIWITIFITNCKDLDDPAIQKQYGSIIGGLKISPPIITSSPKLEENNGKEEDKNEKLSDENLKLSDKIKSFHQNINDQDNNNNDGYVNLNSHKESKKRIQSEELKQLSVRQKRVYKWSKYANVCLYFRKILYAMFIILFADYPYIQLTTISILNLFLAFYYFYITPQDSKLDNIRNGSGEIILFFMQLTVFALVEDNESQPEQERINIGWVFISCAALILGMHIFTVVLDLLRGIFNTVKDFITVAYKFKVDFYMRRKLQQQKREQQLQVQQVIEKILPISKIAVQQSLKPNQKISDRSTILNKSSIYPHNVDSSFISKTNKDNNQRESLIQIIKSPDFARSFNSGSQQISRNESQQLL